MGTQPEWAGYIQPERWVGRTVRAHDREMHPIHRLWSWVARACCPRHAVTAGPLHHPGGHRSYTTQPTVGMHDPEQARKHLGL